MNDEQFVPDRISAAMSEYTKEDRAKTNLRSQQEWMRLRPTRQPLVYVAGPISRGDQFANCREGMYVGDIMRDNGIAPIVPHLSGLWAFLTTYSQEQWLDYDAQLILRCDALYRMEGESTGADWEIRFADAHNIPVYLATDFETVEAFCTHIRKLEMAVS